MSALTETPRPRRRCCGRTGWLAVIAMSASYLISPLLAQAPCYRAIVLPPSIAIAQDVNNDGAVPVGIGEAGERAPAIWTEGRLHEVCGPEVSGVAIAINPNEAVTVVQRRTAIVCETGAAYSLQLPMPGDEPKPADMNDHGTVVGHVNSDDFVRAAAWTDGAVHLLPTLGGWFSVADGINNLGEIVGNATTTAGDQPATLVVRFHEGRRELPIVELRAAA